MFCHTVPCDERMKNFDKRMSLLAKEALCLNPEGKIIRRLQGLDGNGNEVYFIRKRSDFDGSMQNILNIMIPFSLTSKEECLEYLAVEFGDTDPEFIEKCQSKLFFVDSNLYNQLSSIQVIGISYSGNIEESEDYTDR